MLTNEEIFAVCRLRELSKGKTPGEVYGFSPDCGARVREDRQRVSELFLRENPSDDFHLFTTVWLEELRSKPGMGERVGFYCNDAGDLVLEYSQPDGLMRRVMVSIGSTVGDVRKILKWQGTEV